MAEGDRVVFEHARLGRLELPEAEVLRLSPLAGFPGAVRFALVAHDRGGPFAWLASLDEPALAFVVTDPWQFFPDYDPGPPRPVLEALGVKAAEEVELLCLVTLADGVPTLNLAAPLLLCAATRRGAQAILDDARWSTRQALPTPAPAAAAGPPAQIESKPQR